MDIFSLSRNTPDDKDRLIIDSNGSEIRSSGMLSAPGALPSLKPFVIDLSSSAVTWLKLDSESEGTLFIKSWNDLEAVVILSAKFGPMFVKYLQNLLATFSVLVILSPFSSTSGPIDHYITNKSIELIKW